MIVNERRSYQRLDEMASMSRRESGLQCDVWIDSKGAGRNVQHNLPRLKLKTTSDHYIPVSISKDPEILTSQITKKDRIEVHRMIPFLKDAEDILMKHWNQEYSDYKALGELIKLAKSKSY